MNANAIRDCSKAANLGLLATNLLENFGKNGLSSTKFAEKFPVKFGTKLPRIMRCLLLAALIGTAGCGGRATKAQHKDFFTSGSREADQRASQRMAKEEQLSGSGEGSGEKGAKKASSKSEGSSTNKAAQVETKLSLYERLGSEKGLVALVEDFIPRALNDPRVNWDRKGIKRGGFSIHRGDSVSWNANPENVAQLKKHIVQFLALTTGGPSQYDGKEMKSAHAALQISNPEFDASVGDLKASLDKLKIANKEQKELLSIIESTRPEIVTVR
jgi:hemoglobin